MTNPMTFEVYPTGQNNCNVERWEGEWELGLWRLRVPISRITRDVLTASGVPDKYHDAILAHPRVISV